MKLSATCFNSLWLIILFGGTGIALGPLSAEAQEDQWLSNEIAGSPWEEEALQGESVLMAKYPGLVRREGRELTVWYSGKAVATLVPVQNGKSCDRYILGKVLRLYNADTQNLENMAEVVCYAGEFESAIDVLPDGELWHTNGLSNSPNGRLVALNSFNPGQDFPDTGLVIEQWPDRTVLARFEPDCQVLGWADDHQFNVHCVYDPTPRPDDAPFDAKLDNDDIEFDAQIWRNENGLWQMESAVNLPHDPAEDNTALLPPPPLAPGFVPKDPHVSFTAEP